MNEIIKGLEKYVKTEMKDQDMTMKEVEFNVKAIMKSVQEFFEDLHYSTVSYICNMVTIWARSD